MKQNLHINQHSTVRHEYFMDKRHTKQRVISFILLLLTLMVILKAMNHDSGSEGQKVNLTKSM